MKNAPPASAVSPSPTPTPTPPLLLPPPPLGPGVGVLGVGEGGGVLGVGEGGSFPQLQSEAWSCVQQQAPMSLREDHENEPLQRSWQ